eukprot:391759-Pyramimonas_sp.AAC.1
MAAGNSACSPMVDQLVAQLDYTALEEPWGPGPSIGSFGVAYLPGARPSCASDLRAHWVESP